MQPSNALMAIGLSAVVALSSPKAATAQTELEINSLTGGTEGRVVAEDATKLTFADKPLPETTVVEVVATAATAVASPVTPENSVAQVPTNDPADQGEATTREANEAAPTLDRLTVATEPITPAVTAQATPAPTPATPPPVSPSPLPVVPNSDAPSTLSPTSTPSIATPEYLFNDPNPLQFPTRPEEVELIGTQPITLEQAIELARRNSRDLQAAQLTVERARAALRQAQAANLPTLNVGANLTAQEVARQRQGEPNPITGLPEVEITSPLETSLGGNLELSYNLLTGGQRSAAIRANERQARFQELQLEITAEDLRQNVTRDYYSVQEGDELVRIAQSALTQSEQSLRDAQAQEAAGIGTRFDVLQAQVELANAQQELTQQLSQQRIARRQLAQRLNLPQTVDIAAADPIDIADLWDFTLEDSIVLAFRSRAELEQQLVQREISQQQRRIALSATEPQVSLFAGYNVQNNLSTNSGFNDNFQFGAQFNMRLFDGGAARADADQEEANIATAEAQFASARDLVRFQVEQAYFNLQANFENIQTSTLALQQATESLRLARLRFQAGVGIQSDVLRAQTELTRAEVNRLQAVLGYNRSLADLRRAIGNFPDANLADTP